MNTQKRVIVGVSCVHCGPRSKWQWRQKRQGKVYACECGEEQYDLVFSRYENEHLCGKTLYKTSGDIEHLESLLR